MFLRCFLHSKRLISSKNTAGKSYDFDVGLMDSTTVNHDILGLKLPQLNDQVGLMAGAYSNWHTEFFQYAMNCSGI